MLFVMQILTLILTLSACGQNDDSSSSANNEEPKNEISKEETEPTLQSIAIKSFDDLKDCSKDIEDQLAYVIDEENFYVCNDGAWSAIEIKNNVTIVGAGVWIDSVTKRQWTMNTPEAYSKGEYICSGAGLRMPTREEGLAAIEHGILLAQKSSDTRKAFWTNEPLDHANRRLFLDKSTGTLLERWVTTDYVVPIFCIKD